MGQLQWDIMWNSKAAFPEWEKTVKETHSKNYDFIFIFYLFFHIHIFCKYKYIHCINVKYEYITLVLKILPLLGNRFCNI